MAYRNIDSILKDREASLQIISTKNEMSALSEIPESGEKVGVKTLFKEYLRVEVHSVIDGGKICQGAAKHYLYKGAIGDMELVIDNGELIEFSRSKIYGIHRNEAPSPSSSPQANR